MKNLVLCFFLVSILASCDDEFYTPEGQEEYQAYSGCIYDADPIYTDLDEDGKIDLSDTCRITSGWEGFCFFDDIGCE